MRDGTPNPAYIVEWVAAIQKDLMTWGALRVDAEVVTKVQGLKKSFMKHYTNFANTLASQRDFTISVHTYLLYLGPMEKGDWLCVNLDKQAKLETFDSEVLMRAQWQKCNSIELTEVFVPFVVPDSTIEPAPKFNIMGDKNSAGRGRSKVPVSLNQAVAKPVGKPQVEFVELSD